MRLPDPIAQDIGSDEDALNGRRLESFASEGCRTDG